MKSRLVSLVLFASLGLLWGCYPEGPEYVDELDIVYSNYDPEFDFQSKGTYSLPDKIVKITGDDDADIEYVSDLYGVPTLARIDQNMQDLGWTKVDADVADVHLLPAAWTTTTVFNWGYWGDYWCWYYPYYCGGGWYYPYYPTNSSYTTGTLLMTMTDPNEESAIGSTRVVWISAINGLYQGSYNASRINSTIDQAFKQSSYLNTK
jgi:hypothetical protein